MSEEKTPATKTDAPKADAKLVPENPAKTDDATAASSSGEAGKKGKETPFLAKEGKGDKAPPLDKKDGKEDKKASADKKEAPIPSPAPAKKSGGFGAGFLGGVFGCLLVTGGVLGAAYVFQDDLRTQFLAPEIARATGGETARIDTLFDRMQSGEARSATQLNGLSGKISAFDGKIASLEASSRSLADTLEAQQRDIADLFRATENFDPSQQSSRPAAPAIDPSALRALDQRINAAVSEVEALKLDLGKLRNAVPREEILESLSQKAEQAESKLSSVLAERDGAKARLLAAIMLKQALDQGQPYDAELDSVRKLARQGQYADLDKIAPYQNQGIPTRAHLVQDFAKIAQSASQANLKAENGDIWGMIIEKGSQLVTIRRVDPDGTGTDSILSRAESALKQGDLAKTVQEMDSLPELPKQAARQWIDDAKARLLADETISRLLIVSNAAIALP